MNYKGISFQIQIVFASLVILISLIYLYQNENIYDMSMVLKQNQDKYTFDAKPKINTTKVWVSMGLCYSENTNLHGKSQYPYKHVAQLALLLWKYFLPKEFTIIQVYSHYHHPPTFLFLLSNFR